MTASAFIKKWLQQIALNLTLAKNCGKVGDLQGGGLAERGGFEPPIPFWGIRAFQAGQFNHSCISPFSQLFLLDVGDAKVAIFG